MKYNPYSYSKTDSFNSCAYKFKLVYIDKIKETTQNIHLVKGAYVHYKIEKHGNPDIKEQYFDLPDDIREETDKLINIFLSSNRYNELCECNDTIYEQPFALGLNLQDMPYDFKNMKNILYWGKIDKINFLNEHTIHIIDWKTGKYRQYEKQLKEYAIWAFIKYPKVQVIKCSYEYIEHNCYLEKIFTRDKLMAFATDLVKEFKVIENTKQFPKTISKLCEYCSHGPEFMKVCNAQHD